MDMASAWIPRKSMTVSLARYRRSPRLLTSVNVTAGHVGVSWPRIRRHARVKEPSHASRRKWKWKGRERTVASTPPRIGVEQRTLGARIASPGAQTRAPLPSPPIPVPTVRTNNRRSLPPGFATQQRVSAAPRSRSRHDLAGISEANVECEKIQQGPESTRRRCDSPYLPCLVVRWKKSNAIVRVAR